MTVPAWVVVVVAVLRTLAAGRIPNVGAELREMLTQLVDAADEPILFGWPS